MEAAAAAAAATAAAAAAAAAARWMQVTHHLPPACALVTGSGKMPMPHQTFFWFTQGQPNQPAACRWKLWLCLPPGGQNALTRLRCKRLQAQHVCMLRFFLHLGCPGPNSTWFSFLLLFFSGPLCTQLRAVPVLMPRSQARENPSHGERPWPRESKGCSRHAAGERQQLGGVSKDITSGQGMSIDIVRAGEGQDKQARRERTSSCKGQDGRPAEGESRGACCPRGGWCGAGAAPCEQTDEGGCFSAPPDTNLDAQHRQVAASGIDKFRVSSLLGPARSLESSSCSAAAVVPWSPG